MSVSGDMPTAVLNIPACSKADRRMTTAGSRAQAELLSNRCSASFGLR
jgi:hypothetical protein